MTKLYNINVLEIDGIEQEGQRALSSEQVLYMRQSPTGDIYIKYGIEKAIPTLMLVDGNVSDIATGLDLKGVTVLFINDNKSKGSIYLNPDLVQTIKPLTTGSKIFYGDDDTYTYEFIVEEDIDALSALFTQTGGGGGGSGVDLLDGSGKIKDQHLPLVYFGDNFKGEGTPEDKYDLIVSLQNTGDGTQFLSDDGTYKSIPGGTGGDGSVVTVDSTISPVSTNPVQNKIIHEALGLKADKTELATLQGVVDDKVNKDGSKVLSDVNFSTSLKSQYDAVAAISHTHANKSFLDTLNQGMKDLWDSAVTHISDAVRHITGAERTSWNGRLIDVIQGSNVTIDKTDPLRPVISSTATGGASYTHPNHSGDIVSVNDGATTIQPNVVTNAKLAQMANGTFKGNVSGATANASDLSATQMRNALSINNVDNTADSAKPVSTAQAAVNATKVDRATSRAFSAVITPSANHLQTYTGANTTIAFSANLTGAVLDYFNYTTIPANTATGFTITSDFVMKVGITLDFAPTLENTLYFYWNGSKIEVYLDNANMGGGTGGAGVTDGVKGQITISGGGAIYSVNETSEKQLVSQTQINTWNGKQNALTEGSIAESLLSAEVQAKLNSTGGAGGATGTFNLDLGDLETDDQLINIDLGDLETI